VVSKKNFSRWRAKILSANSFHIRAYRPLRRHHICVKTTKSTVRESV
jgi:hypothetical protein